jgi:hypothetical protein
MCNRLSIGLAFLWLIGVVGPVSGRIVKNWSYEQLFETADVIVLAVPVGSEKAPDAFDVEHSWPLDVVGVNTTFQVRHTLKGKVDGRQVKMLHFRFVEPPKRKFVVIEDGPGFVAIRSTSLRVKEGDSVLDLPAPEYLLFLRRLKDGRYEPVSGRVDPRFSVREVNEPLDDTFGKRR